MERMETVEWGCGDSGSTDEKEKKEKRAEGGVRARATDRQKGTLEVGSKRSERWAEIRAGILRTYALPGNWVG